MKRIIFTTLLLLINFSMFSQGTRIITLKEDSTDKILSAFKITKVLDDRKNKSNIGVLNSGFLGSKKEAKLKKGVTLTIKDYLDQNTVIGGSARVIQIRVLRFNIYENKSKDRGTVKVHFEFLGKDAEGWYVFKDFSKTISDTIMSGNHSDRHEARIRQVLKASIQYLNSSDSLDLKTPKAQPSNSKCSPITISADGKLLQYQGKSYKSINELGAVFNDCGNEEIKRMFKSYRRVDKFGYILGLVGGFLIGWEVGGWLASGEINQPTFISGAVLVTTSIMMELGNGQKARIIIENYNTYLISLE